MRCPRFVPLVLVLLASLSAAARAENVTGWFSETNTSDNEMTGWGRDFTLPANASVTGVSAHRWNPITHQWVDESASWGGNIAQNPAGTWHVSITNQGAASFGKGVKMKFDVKFIVPYIGDIGVVRGVSRTYAVNPAPKKGQKNGDHKGGGVPALPAAHVDSGLYWGGASGSSVPGLSITIPPNTYAYVYQIFVRPGSPNVTSFRLPSAANRFSSLVQKSFKHNGAIDSSFVGYGATMPPDPGVLDSSSVAVFEASGGSGVSALSWGSEGSDVVARFTGMSGGQSSNVLVGMSSLPPDNVGVVDNEILGTASTSDYNRVLAPVPFVSASSPGMTWWGKLVVALMLLSAGAFMLRTRERGRTTA